MVKLVWHVLEVRGEAPAMDYAIRFRLFKTLTQLVYVS